MRKATSAFHGFQGSSLRTVPAWKLIEANLLIIPQSAASSASRTTSVRMHHSRQPARAVSAGVRARARKYNTVSSSSSSSSSYMAVSLDDSTATATTSAAVNINSEVVSPAEQPVYEPSWLRTGRSSMAAEVHIPSFLIPCSASQLMDARYKSRKFSRATVSDAKAISPAA